MTKLKNPCDDITLKICFVTSYQHDVICEQSKFKLTEEEKMNKKDWSGQASIQERNNQDKLSMDKITPVSLC